MLTPARIPTAQRATRPQSLARICDPPLVLDPVEAAAARVALPIAEEVEFLLALAETEADVEEFE